MPKQLIYRVEHKRWRHGPYMEDHMHTKAALILQDRILKSHRNCPEHPPIIGDPDKHRCGCASLEALQLWFKEFWNALIRAGYVIRVYSVVVEKSTDKQLIYIANTAEEIKTIRMERI